MEIIDFYSFEQQDEFILNLFKHTRNGFFIDSACGHPILGNNTYTLEKNFGWKGFCFDLNDFSIAEYVTGNDQAVHTVQWEQVRSTPFVKLDLTSEDFTNFLRENISEEQIVDYISLDVDWAGKNYALEVLGRIFDAGITFKSITLEHEIYLNDQIQATSRQLLESKGYKRLFSNVRLWAGAIQSDDGLYSEDWWIHPDYFEPDLLNIARSNDYYFNCVRAIQTKEYQGNHHCCQAFAKEVDLFTTYGSHGYSTHPIRAAGYKSAWE